MNNNINRQIKTIIVLIAAFIITSTLSRTVFVANTTRINKAFIAELKDFPQHAFRQLKRYYASRQTPPTPQKKTDFAAIENLPNTALKSVAKGVYAHEEDGNIVYIRMTKDVEFEEKEINYEGKKIKVRFPKGMLH